MENTEMAAQVEPQNIFHEVDSGARPAASNTDGISPRSTRWAMIPIWPTHGLPPTAFKLNSFPASKFVPLRIFNYPVASATGDTHDKETGIAHTRERLPAEQIADLYAIAGDSKFAVDFLELAKLEDEALAREVLSVIANPNACSTYPNELKNICSTCWIDYLRGDAATALADKYSGNKVVLEAAVKSAARLLTALEQSVIKARGDVDVAIREIDDPKTGKDRFYDADYLNIWHTHQGMPEFRTSTGIQSQLNEVIKAFTAATQSDGSAHGLSIDDVKALIAEAVSDKDAEITRLKALVGNDVEFGLGDPVTVGGKDGVITEVKTAGWYVVQFADETTASVRKNQMEIRKDETSDQNG